MKKISYDTLLKLSILSLYIISILYIIIFQKNILYLILTCLLLTILIFKTTFISILGNINYSIGKIEKAIKYYDLAIKNQTKISTVYLNYGVYLLNNGNIKKALEYLTIGKNINKNIIVDKNIMVTMGCCYWALNEIDKAIKILEQIRSKYDYVNINILTTLGYMYFLKKMYDKALEITNLALEEDKNCAAVWDSLGQIYFTQEKFEKAKHTFKKALCINKYLPESNYYLGIIYEKESNYEKAKECFINTKKCNLTPLSYIKEKEINEKYNKYNKSNLKI